MPDGFKYDVVLSHSSKDTDVVRDIAEYLRGDGLKVWFDKWEIMPGDSIPSKIEEGLEASHVLVFCVSTNAFGSDWATLESQTFRFQDPLNKQRRFIPVRLDDAPVKGSLAQFRHISWPSEGPHLLDACRGSLSHLASPLPRADIRQPSFTDKTTVAAELMRRVYESFQHVHDYRIKLDQSILRTLPVEIRGVFVFASRHEWLFGQEIVHATEAYKLAAECAVARIMALQELTRGDLAELNAAEGAAVADMVTSYHCLSACVGKHGNT